MKGQGTMNQKLAETIHNKIRPTEISDKENTGKH